VVIVVMSMSLRVGIVSNHATYLAFCSPSGHKLDFDERLDL
jgi:hypothetical protein